MKPLFPEDQPVLAVPIADLNRRTSAVIAAVDRGERVVVTKHGRPLGVILPAEQALELLVSNDREALRSLLNDQPVAARRTRNEALRRLVGDEVYLGWLRRREGRLGHGRWYEMGSGLLADRLR